MDYKIPHFKSGTHNLLEDEIIPVDAASNSYGWFTRDGEIQTMRGRELFGSEGANGKVHAEHTAYRVDGTQLRFRKLATKVQYHNGTDWVDVITGLTDPFATAANYSSLAGTFVYIFNRDGIYKICTANPTSYATLYNSTKNFKGYGIIDKGRSILWGREDDQTGLYGSYIDAQDATVYTTVASEALASVAAGTLAFKAGGATRSCFGVQITVTTSGQVFTDDFNGNLVGDAGGSGTINYMTGAFTTDDTGAGTADYQWEDSNDEGVTDFSKSAPRGPGEGFIFRQDIGGDSIQRVIALEGSYFSLKEKSVYKLTISDDDTDADNNVFRSDIGISTRNAAVATSQGIVYLNTANPSKPVLSIIEKNPIGDNFTSKPLFNQFAFEDYDFTDVVLASWDRYVIVTARENADANNRMIMCNMLEKIVDVAPYEVSSFCQFNGLLHAGSSLSETSYVLFSGFDDIGFKVPNIWEGRSDTYDRDSLKKVKRIRLKGNISANSTVKVYVSYDNDGYTQIGTIRGDGSYVDYSNPTLVGASLVGEELVGGGVAITVYPYFIEFKIRSRKFRARKFKFVRDEIGYATIQKVTDVDIWEYQDKLPAKYRQKQNVSLDGTLFNQ